MTDNENKVMQSEVVEVVDLAKEMDGIPDHPLEPPKEKTESAGRLVVRLTVRLLAITAFVALMLGGVNAITKEPIAKYAQEKREAAMEAVMKEGRVWSAGDEVTVDISTSKNPPVITPMTDLTSSYCDENGIPHALCVETHPSGYGGEITLMVGINITPTDSGYDTSVQAVRIVSHSETSGVGSKTADPGFLDQYSGKVVGITINGSGNSINAISGATISSKAVTAGVNEALTAANEYISRVLAGQLPPGNGMTVKGGGDQ